MILPEYAHFMQTLVGPSVHANVRKIANLVFLNLNELIPLSTAHGLRIKKIVELAQATWENLCTEITAESQDLSGHCSPCTRVKSLTVGPFRGFSKPERFDLQADIVLIYGPNGTGKSSFCEALEFGLLENVIDAESKRFRDQRDYLKNAYCDAFESPEIIGVDGVRIVPDESKYRFCFVEKNRIDNFSRIAAQTPSKQTELISSLFGLDSFNDFVKNFSETIDGKHIDLIGIKASILEQKRQALAGAHAILNSNKIELEKLNTEENSLASSYRCGVNFNQLEIELNGDGERPGLIREMELELQQPMQPKAGLSALRLATLQQAIEKNLQKWSSQQSELLNAGNKVSFKELYDALLKLQPSAPDICPACNTPISIAASNPYTHASEELLKLSHLAELQISIQRITQELNQSLIELSGIVTVCCNSFSTNIVHGYKFQQNSQTLIEWWNSLQNPLQDGATPWQHIEAQVNQLEDNDKKIDILAGRRAAKQQKLITLREYAQKIVSLKTRRVTANDAINIASKEILEFEIKNAQLITEVEAEKAKVARNYEILNAYSDFVKRLNVYNSNLPSLLVEDLGEVVVKLYNAFNRNDASSQKLFSVHLPLAQNQSLEISFFDNPDKFFNALHVFSEGHIRCMGLAILMAKNIKENCPLIIFDDPVNAIDDEHRESIRRTLFEDSFFKGKQIILTCHGEEFFKDIQNLLPRTKVVQSKLFAFLPRLDGQDIRVDFNCPPRNYIVAARNHIERGEIRNALSNSRRALELLANEKLWPYVIRYGDGNLSIKLRSAKSPIELRNLIEQLKSKICKQEFSDPNKTSVLEIINTILGNDGSSREWRYLNKGTHEEIDRAEFDRCTVLSLISSLEQLDDVLRS